MGCVTATSTVTPADSTSLYGHPSSTSRAPSTIRPSPGSRNYLSQLRSARALTPTGTNGPRPGYIRRNAARRCAVRQRLRACAGRWPHLRQAHAARELDLWTGLQPARERAGEGRRHTQAKAEPARLPSAGHRGRQAPPRHGQRARAQAGRAARWLAGGRALRAGAAGSGRAVASARSRGAGDTSTPNVAAPRRSTVGNGSNR